MDSTTSGVLGIFGILASGAGLLYTAINHKKFKCVCNYDCLTKKSNINDRNTIYIKINKQNIFKVINIWTCNKNINKINIPWKKNITC